MNYAIALAIMDTEKITYDTRILVGVRRPESNAQHPGVVSVPSERIPEAVIDTIPVGPPTSPLIACGGHPGAHQVTYAVKSVLSQKLGLADRLELGSIRFTAAPRLVFSGKSPRLSSGDISEPWTMLLAEVHLSERRLPLADTASYEHLDWLRVDDFLKKAAGEDFPKMARCSTAPLAAYEKMGGLCIESTAKWLHSVLD